MGSAKLAQFVCLILKKTVQLFSCQDADIAFMTNASRTGSKTKQHALIVETTSGLVSCDQFIVLGCNFHLMN